MKSFSDDIVTFNVSSGKDHDTAETFKVHKDVCCKQTLFLHHNTYLVLYNHRSENSK